MGFIIAEILNSYPKLREFFEIPYKVSEIFERKIFINIFYEKFKVCINNTHTYFRTLPNPKLRYMVLQS